MREECGLTCEGVLMRTIFNSDGTQLHFTDADEDLYQTYKASERLLMLSMYERLKQRNGVWASNQNKYVPSVDDLNDSDSRVMEELEMIDILTTVFP
jgi:hypothetical protein